MVVFAPLALDNNNSFSVGQFADHFHIPHITHLHITSLGTSVLFQIRGQVAPCMCKRVASSLLLLPPIVEDLRMRQQRSTVSFEVEESTFLVFVLGLG